MLLLRVRGSSLIEAALLTPIMAGLLFAFVNLGSAFFRQVQLEQMAVAMARDLAVLPEPSVAPAVAVEWLAAHGRPDVSADVHVIAFPTLPRAFPRNNLPQRAIAVTLRRSHRGSISLSAHAREAVL